MNLLLLSVTLTVLLTAVQAVPRTFQELVTHFKGVVYRVETREGRFIGTAFAINIYGDMLTCYHVVDKYRVNIDSIVISNAAMAGLEAVDSVVQREMWDKRFAVVRAVVPDLDIAVLHADTGASHSPLAKLGLTLARFPFATLSKIPQFHEGDEVALCAFIPDSFPIPRAFVSRGIISTMRPQENMKTTRTPVDVIQMDLTVAYGTSGGPVWETKTGKVIAIQDAGFFPKGSFQSSYPIAIGIHQVIPILDSLGIPYDAK